MSIVNKRTGDRRQRIEVGGKEKGNCLIADSFFSKWLEYNYMQLFIKNYG
jgi:hypothetical protein